METLTQEPALYDPASPYPQEPAPTPSSQKVKRRYRLLQGSAVFAHPTAMVDAGPEYRRRDGPPVMVPRDRLYRAASAGGRPGIDDIIESDVDLRDLDRFGGKKFELIEEIPVPPRETDLRQGETPAQFAARIAEWASRQSQAAQTRPDEGGQSTTNAAEAAKAGFNTLHTDSGRTPPQTEPTPAAAGAGRPPAWNPQEHKALLESMTVAELRKHAEEEEVPLGTAKTKDEIVKVLLAADRTA